ncbi:MAG: LacI family DNA-binding transcriptional regulator, partial [Dongia sp.]
MDVAERAGVSKSTVSNVIRGTAMVAEETRLR